MSLSIVLPYLSKSKSISLCKDLLYKNTKNDFELIEIVDNTDVYEAFNSGVLKSKNDIVVLINDDMFVSPNWDVLYCKHIKPKMVLTGYLIESGYLIPNSRCIEMNFGTDIESFDYDSFIQYSNNLNYPEIVENSKGWYMPVCFNKSTFIPYPNEIKYPHPNDVLLIDHILENMGYTFCKVASYVYHLQRYSTR